jgi:NADH-ubiquinone oxidoreductase chain 5|tara:strand:+ start:11809 stop:12084 length:276 start_codon:yes stop_codon:yes gene_type:complete
MLIPLFVLCFGSVFAGFIFKDAFIGLGTPFFENSIFVLFCPIILEAEFLNTFLKNLPLNFTLLGFILSFFSVYAGSLKLKKVAYTLKVSEN